MSAEPTIIRHHREEAYAVTFERNGRAYRTIFTRRRGEAEIWAHSVRVYGWSVSGRPYPVDPDDIIQTVEGTA